MIEINVNKTDISKLLKKFNNIKKFSTEETDKIFGYTASQISKRAKKDAPFKTGFLRSTINWGKDKNDNKIFVRAEAKYAPYLEYGTKYQKAQPYFYSNAKLEIKLMTNRILKLLRKQL
jgi:HK97 gp10 family phage protein